MPELSFPVFIRHYRVDETLATILMTILEEKHHSILIVENDPVLY